MTAAPASEGGGEGADRSLLSYLRRAAGFLTTKGVDNPRLDAEVLLGDVLGLDRVGLYLQFDRPLGEDEVVRYRAAVQRRGRREPLQYVRGKQEFYGREFRVDPSVLVPRADTEALVEEALGIARGRAGLRILDLGSGSGALAVTLALELPGATVIAVEVSAEAVGVGRENAVRLGAAVDVRQGDLLAPVAGECFDLVVCNPPYVLRDEIAALAPEVSGFEPRSALDGGRDGLDFYRRLALEAPGALAEGARLLIEIGAGRRPAVTALFADAGWKACGVRTDLAGIERVLGFER